MADILDEAPADDSITVDGAGTALVPMHKINASTGEIERIHANPDPKVQADLRSLGWTLGEV